MLPKRAALEQAEVDGASAEICKKILLLQEVMQADTVGIYISIKNEVMAELLLDSLLAFGKKVFVPVLEGEEMKFALLNSLEGLATGKHGVPEPEKKVFAKGGEINVFIVPGAAFDVKGYRLGWGKGNYDRFLSKQNAVKIGVAYDFQIVDSLPAEKHDVKMDFVVTEKQILKI